MLSKEGSNGAGRSAERDENERKSHDEREGRAEQTRARSIACLKLLDSDSGKHRDVARHKRQDARREKRNEPSDEGREYGYFHLIFLRFLHAIWMCVQAQSYKGFKLAIFTHSLDARSRLLRCT